MKKNKVKIYNDRRVTWDESNKDQYFGNVNGKVTIFEENLLYFELNF